MGTLLKYDVEGVEDFAPYDGPTPKRGIYTLLLSDDGNEWKVSGGGHNMLVLQGTLAKNTGDKKQFDGFPVWVYVTVGDLSEVWMKRNFKSIVNTFGLKSAGSFNGDALVKKISNGKTLVRVVLKEEKSEEYGEQVKANGILPYKKTEEPEPEEDEAEETTEVEADEAEEEETASEDVSEEEDEEEDEEDDDEEEGDEEVDEITAKFVARRDILAGLDRTALKVEVRNAGLKTLKSDSDDDLRLKVMHAEFDFEDDEAEDGDTPF